MKCTFIHQARSQILVRKAHCISHRSVKVMRYVELSLPKTVPRCLPNTTISRGHRLPVRSGPVWRWNASSPDDHPQSRPIGIASGSWPFRTCTSASNLWSHSLRPGRSLVCIGNSTGLLITNARPCARRHFKSAGNRRLRKPSGGPRCLGVER